MTDTPLLRLARLTLRLAGDATGSDADSLNLHAALFDLVCDLEAAPPPIVRRAAHDHAGTAHPRHAGSSEGAAVYTSGRRRGRRRLSDLRCHARPHRGGRMRRRVFAQRKQWQRGVM